MPKDLITPLSQTLQLPKKVLHALSIEFRALFDVARFGLPDVMLQFGGGIGDELLLTVVARELKRRKPGLKVWQVSHSLELLEGNPDYDRVFSLNHWPLRYALFLRSRRCSLSYTTEKISRVQDDPPKSHILAALCENAGIRGNVSLRPYLMLTKEEKKAGLLAERQIALQCIGPTSYNTVMKNKLWDSVKFQEVVDRIRAESGDTFTLIQLGSAGDVGLSGVTDLRGKTSLRESAAILYQSECFIGTVGFLMHLSRAVECRSVILYGGREHAWQTGYICNENLESRMDCAPCWSWEECSHERKCMDDITADDVVNAFGRVQTRRRMPLETEEVFLEGAEG